LPIAIEVARPLAARPAASSWDARLVRIEKLDDRVDVRVAKTESLEDGARTCASLHEAVDHEEAALIVALHHRSRRALLSPPTENATAPSPPAI
jgi:hypothetical protein